VKFLCDYHEERFAALSVANRQDVWLLWIDEALNQYQQRRLRDAVKHAGCAFDLACLGESKEPGSMPVELTLAAIFLLRALAEYGVRSECHLVRARALSVLECCPGDTEANRCRAVLCDQFEQSGFFQSYFNWPFIADPCP